MEKLEKVNNKKIVFVCDVDGTLTDGKMYYTTEGKYMKAFGCDCWDALKLLNKKVELSFITGDKKGFAIVEKRIKEEMKFDLCLVSHLPKERWEWIDANFPKKDYIVCFMGDGIFDYQCLKNADLSFTVSSALEHIKDVADCVIWRAGANRAVAEACIKIDEHFELECFPKEIYSSEKNYKEI